MEALTDFIVQKKENGLTNFEVAEILKNYQRSKGESTYGFSERSVRRFCKRHEIERPPPLTDGDLRTAVDHAVKQVGPLI